MYVLRLKVYHHLGDQYISDNGIAHMWSDLIKHKLSYHKILSQHYKERFCSKNISNTECMH